MLATLFILAALVAGEVAAYEQVEAEDYRSLESVYGHLTKSRKTVQARERAALFQEETQPETPSSRGNRGARADTTDDPPCDLGFDILILQDATGSFLKDYEVTAEVTLPALKEIMQRVAPDSRFSLVTFRDKPLHRLGELDDDCFQIHAMNAVDPTDLAKTFLSEVPTGGNDIPENQFGAMVAAIQSPKTIPWHTDKNRVGVIFLVTDAVPHFAEDNTHPVAGPLTPFDNGPYDEDKAEEFCTERGYPSANVVREVLLNEHIYLAVTVVPRPDQPGSAALATWQWFNGYVGYPARFVQEGGDGMAWTEEFVQAVSFIYGEQCDGTPTYFPTWTPAPTTTEGRPVPPVVTEAPQPPSALPPLPRTTVLTAPVPHPPTPRPSVPPLATGATDLPEENSTDNCKCPSQPEGKPDPCCQRQPEVLIAIMEQPEELDIHFRGHLRLEGDKETNKPE